MEIIQKIKIGDLWTPAERDAIKEQVPDADFDKEVTLEQLTTALRISGLLT